MLSDNTDGRAIVNRNDLAVGMKQIVRDASGYYLLGYNSTQAPTDGQVPRDQGPRDAAGRRRPRPQGLLGVHARGRAARDGAAEAGRAVGRDGRAQRDRGAGPRPCREVLDRHGKGTNGSPRVTFAWEPMSSEEAQARGAESGANRVMLTATAPDGRPVFRGRIPEEGAAPAGNSGTTMPSSGGSAASTPVAAGASASFDAATRTASASHGRREQPRPGDGLRDPGTDSSGLLQSAGVPQHAARLQRSDGPRSAVDQGEAAAIPIADRTFSRAERLYVRVEAYSARRSRARSFGATPQSRTARRWRNRRCRQRAPGQGEFELALSALAAGDYVIEINAKTATGTAQELIAFKVSR